MIQLSDHFTYKKLLKFTFPSMVMMIFTSIYSVVDGYFISNFVGKTPFAAVNFIMPFVMMLGAIGFMFGTGGSALVAKTAGEGDIEKANRLFSLFVYAAIILGVVVTILGIIFIRPIAVYLGAEGEMLDLCVIYGRILLATNPAFILQMLFQSFFVAAEKPNMGLFVTVAAGVTNIVLDFLLVAIIPMGLVGAALATSISQLVGGVVPLIYFIKPKNCMLRLVKTDFDKKALLKGCANGMSELFNNIAMSIVGMLYNFQLIKYAGENGIAAYGVIMYAGFVFSGVYIGFSVGSAPVVSYHYGAQNHDELKSLKKKSLTLLTIFAAVIFILSQLSASFIAEIFVGYDGELFEFTAHAFRVYAAAYLFMGFAIFFSGFFTALNDGVISAVISVLRTMVFQVTAVLVLPVLIDIDGIWISVAIAEGLAALIGMILLMKNRKKYGY